MSMKVQNSTLGRSTLTKVPRVSPGFVIACAVFGFWVVAALFGMLLVPHDPFEVQLNRSLLPPDVTHVFGTDNLGRDIFSRVIVGSRDILSVAFFAALIGTLLGTVVGLSMGYFRGILDNVLSRIAEAVISVPGVIIALLLIAAVGRSNAALIAVIAFEFMWVVARTVRAAVLQEAAKDYVLAAQARGDGPLTVMLRELLPNIFPIVVVEFTVRMTFAVFAVANLSFLGFGVQPPAPDWGLQVAESYGLLVAGFWWTALFPTLAIASLVISIYIIANEANRWLSGVSLPD